MYPTELRKKSFNKFLINCISPKTMASRSIMNYSNQPFLDSKEELFRCVRHSLLGLTENTDNNQYYINISSCKQDQVP